MNPQNFIRQTIPKKPLHSKLPNNYHRINHQNIHSNKIYLKKQDKRVKRMKNHSHSIISHKEHKKVSLILFRMWD